MANPVPLIPGEVVQPPAKRSRHDLDTIIAETDGNVNAVERSSSLWFNDGNIVLIASGVMAFRVHRGVLAYHSTVFDDLFQLPQPEEGELMDGCPIVHISDRPVDVSHLLHALYDGPGFFKHGQLLPFGVVAALVELGYKYHIEAARAEGLQRMRTCFCNSFKAMQATQWIDIKKNNETGGMELGLISSSLLVILSKHAIRAVNLIRVIDEMEMLPMALYLCTLLPVSALVPRTTTPAKRVHILNEDDLVRCLEARAVYAVRDSKFRERLWSTDTFNDVCAGLGDCATIIASRSNFEAENMVVASVRNPLGGYEAAIREQTELCSGCTEELLTVQREEIRRIWQRLPTDFGLEVPHWDWTL
ncbi:hypothetical protein C8Q79DRAFT_956136 [Trametes meyenii]|nr:hypothetical protein C8Q79DRAFT_956136 [Trametes meyenii]